MRQTIPLTNGTAPAAPTPASQDEAAVRLPVTARMELDGHALAQFVRQAVRSELADLEARLVELRDLVAASRSVEGAAPTKGTTAPAATPEEPADVVLTTAELAARLKTSTDTIWRRVAAGSMPPPVRPSAKCRGRWPLAMIEAWEALGCPPAEEFAHRWKARQTMQSGKR